MGRVGVGTARPAPLRRPDLRPPGQHRTELRTAPRARRVGARVLLAVPQRTTEVRRGDVEHRQLVRRRAALRPRARNRPGIAQPGAGSETTDGTWSTRTELSRESLGAGGSRRSITCGTRRRSPRRRPATSVPKVMPPRSTDATNRRSGAVITPAKNARAAKS